jgi:DNA-binding winged helix-turn-helix (wHTH) protein/tetratricopeptide (TPR) repeat protein
VWTRVRFGEFVFDGRTTELLRDGKKVPLSPKAGLLLGELLAVPGELLSREELEERVWPDVRVAEGSIRVRVNEIRSVLGDSGKQASFVETVPRRGYRFIAKVRPVETEAPEPWERPALAVMHFDASHGGERAAVLAEGLADSLVAILTRWGELPVVAPSADTRGGGRSGDVRRMGHALGALLTVGGRVQDDGQRVRVYFELANTQSGERLAAGSFDYDDPDPLEIQDRAAARISNSIKGKIHRAAPRREPEPDAVTRAWEHTIRGHALFTLSTPEGHRQAREAYQQALELDPFSAPAHCDISTTHSIDIAFGFSPDRAASVRAALEHAERALEIDAQLPGAHLTMGAACLCAGDARRALVHLEHAEELDPSEPLTTANRARALLMLGRAREAYVCSEDALARLSDGFGAELALLTRAEACLALGDLDSARESAERSIVLVPAWNAYCVLAVVELLRDAPDEARKALDEARRLRPSLRLRHASAWFKASAPSAAATYGTLLEQAGLRDSWMDSSPGQGRRAALTRIRAITKA